MRRALSKFGAYTRTHAQRSMRTRKGASAPGTPPNAHGSRLLRKLLYFALSADGRQVVAGPILKSSTKSIGVPRMHEKGGTVTRLHKGKQRTQRYDKRPFMKPAGEANVKLLPQWYAQ